MGTGLAPRRLGCEEGRRENDRGRRGEGLEGKREGERQRRRERGMERERQRRRKNGWEGEGWRRERGREGEGERTGAAEAAGEHVTESRRKIMAAVKGGSDT